MTRSSRLDESGSRRGSARSVASKEIPRMSNQTGLPESFPLTLISVGSPLSTETICCSKTVALALGSAAIAPPALRPEESSVQALRTRTSTEAMVTTVRLSNIIRPSPPSAMCHSIFAYPNVRSTRAMSPVRGALVPSASASSAFCQFAPLRSTQLKSEIHGSTGRKTDAGNHNRCHDERFWLTSADRAIQRRRNRNVQTSKSPRSK